MKADTLCKTLLAVIISWLTLSLSCGIALAAEQNSNPQSLASLEDARAAQQALDRFFRAYETGNTGAIRNMIDPSMIGYQQFLDGIRRDMTSMKQLRIHLYDTRVIAGPDVTVIHTKWEKRFLSATDLSPGTLRGSSTFLLHKMAGGWKFAALAGDNLLSSSSGALAKLTFTPTQLSYSSLPAAIVAAPPPMSGFNIVVEDPDLIGSGSITVEFRTSQGDLENFTLSETSPGRFSRSTLNIEQNVVGAAATTNGRLIIDSSPLPCTVTMRYVDRNPGNGQPARNLSASITIQ